MSEITKNMIKHNWSPSDSPSDYWGSNCICPTCHGKKGWYNGIDGEPCEECEATGVTRGYFSWLVSEIHKDRETTPEFFKETWFWEDNDDCDHQCSSNTTAPGQPFIIKCDSCGKQTHPYKSWMDKRAYRGMDE